MAAKNCCHGPGYATPLDAMKNGPRETLLYVVTVQPNLEEPHGDYLSTVDVNPESPSYSQVIHRTYTNRTRQELHHSGWNACSSCYRVDKQAKRIPKRDKLVLPALNADAIYVLDVATDPRKPEILKRIDGAVLKQHNVTAPHTTHCLANGQVMISVMGDAEGNAKGDFILFDSESFECLGTWTQGKKLAAFGYDFWYQPYFDIMVSSEWGAPAKFRQGWSSKDMSYYGTHLNFYKWSTRTLQQTIDLGDEGITPLEVRFMHDPKRAEGFVGCALWAKVFYFRKREESDEYVSSKVIDIPSKLVDFGDGKPEPMGGLISDIVLSLDDKYLFVNCWFHGDVRQYDVSVPSAPKLVGQVFLGGSICSDVQRLKVLEDKELLERPPPCYLKGRRIQGGPQMMQLSLDSKRLYVSSSLFSPWDKQFYPDMVKQGGQICLINVNIEGGLQLNENFLVDFGQEPNGPALPHEMRYPGGDCTSDIWLADQ
ncbi:methanethiol oxidase-like isoform X2 [Scaptodrosophila lebanonensis]|uniref:Methanethiol oxidase-like isoform X2 n=1 Tax=Drosophila lebanonensis TaxID=7225 RepID=A0A6J2T9N0_DROLE|nr:methanethiol oxidase-like isoform X2 [Scaptodrosophila lebanonensis]